MAKKKPHESEKKVRSFWARLFLSFSFQEWAGSKGHPGDILQCISFFLGGAPSAVSNNYYTTYNVKGA